MTRITRKLLPALLAILALTAVTATAAQATVEGPYFKIGGKRLEAGQTAEVKMNFGKSGFTARNGTGTFLECTGMKLKSGAKFVGSTGANSGKIEGAFEFTNCEQYEGGSLVCKAKTIDTKTLTGTLAYEHERSGGIALRFGKADQSEITEGECGELTGGVTFETFKAGAGADKVGSEPAEAASWTTFMNAGSKTTFAEVSGKLVGEQKWLLFDGGGTVTESPGLIEGVELTSGAKWGIYTTA